MATVTAHVNSRCIGDHPPSTTFENIRNGVGTQVYSPSASSNLTYIRETYTASPYLHRTFLVFDLSTISAQFSAASLYVYVHSETIDTGDNTYIVQGISGGDVPTVADDWLSANSETTYFIEKSNSDIDGKAGQWVEFALNSAGIAYLKSAAGGYAKLVLMTERDFDNNYDNSSHTNEFFIYLPQETDKEPYLSLYEKFPSWNLSRVTAMRHVYRPGSYRMESTLGDVSTSVEIAKETIQVPSGEKGAPSTEITVPSKSVPDVVEALKSESAVAMPEQVSALRNLWRGLTPWSETAGETSRTYQEEKGGLIQSVHGMATHITSSVWRTMTPWKEESGETFGSEVKERVTKMTDWFKDLF